MVPAALALVLIVAACYWPAGRLGFVNFDDPLYVTGNPHVQAGLTWEGFLWAFQDMGSSNWHPLTWLSHMLDWSLFGADARGHHLTNVLLHGLNTLLLFTALSALTGAPGRSACVAALFAVHPVNVESVAWVAERKNLLSTALGLMALQGWAAYVRRPGWKQYLPVAACHGLGLMAKPMLVTLPFLLLLMDYWPCRRMAFRGSPLPFSRLVLEKVPLLALSAASVAVTFAAAAEGGALKTLDHFPLGLRLANALNAYLLYIGKLLWPFDLAVFYPYAAPSLLRTALAAALIGGMTLLALGKARQAPWLPTGWFWYLGTLVPVIGLVQVGRQSMADRYAYVPFIGLFMILVWLSAGLPARLQSWTTGGAGRRRAAFRVPAIAALIATVVFWGALSQRQLVHWQSSRALFEQALAVNPVNDIAHNNLAHALFQEGDWEGAIAHFREAIRINPRYANAYDNLGTVLDRQGRTREAVGQYRLALALEPGHAGAKTHLARALETLRREEGQGAPPAGGEPQKRLDPKTR